MSRLRRTTLIAAALLAALAGAAEAKNISRVVLCGVDDCRTIDDKRQLHQFLGGSETYESPRASEDRYRGRMVFDAGRRNHVEHFLYAPDSDKMQFTGDGMSTTGSWMQLSGSSKRAWHRAARGLEPFPGRDRKPDEAGKPDEVEPAPSDEDASGTGSGGGEEGLDAGLIVGGALALGAAAWAGARRLHHRP